MPAVYEYLHTVGDDEIDDQGHAGNVEYVKWMQAAALAHSAAQGWPPQRYRETGAGWVVRTHQIHYLQSAFAGESIVVRTWVADFRKVTSLRKYAIYRQPDDELLVRAETDWAFIGRERGAPRRIPQELIESFEVVADE